MTLLAEHKHSKQRPSNDENIVNHPSKSKFNQYMEIPYEDEPELEMTRQEILSQTSHSPKVVQPPAPPSFIWKNRNQNQICSKMKKSFTVTTLLKVKNIDHP